MIEIQERDVKIKCKKFRKIGQSTGTLLKKNGEKLLIILNKNKINSFVRKFGVNNNIELNFNEETLNVKIIGTFRNVYTREIDNIDFKEI
ncbi:MAG: hypothetical protein ACRDDY_12750 [Clostridium sp.]|uniref:hypothetical protein n=1 Tax=Clostridium sp. TaxID=1506 RepID=UPI003EE5CC4A